MRPDPFMRFDPVLWWGRLRERFLHFEAEDWTRLMLKALSLVLAGIFYLMARQPTSDVRLPGVPIEYSGLAPELEITGEITRTVTLRVRGPRDLVRGLIPTQLAVTANLSNKGAGQRGVQLSPKDVVALPIGVDALQVEPASIMLRIEPTLHKTVRVEPQITLPDEGYEVYHTRIEPNTVQIEGPQSQLEKLTQLRTEIINLAGQSRSVRVMSDVELSLPGLRVIPRQPLAVTIELGERRIPQVLRAIPVVTSPASAGTSFHPAQVQVMVMGAPSDLKLLREQDIQAIVSLSELPSNATSAQPHIKLPEALAGRLEIRSVTPSAIAITQQPTQGKHTQP